MTDRRSSDALPSVTVILPTYNRCDVVRQTLVQLSDQDYPPELIEILVCDNSSDGTPEMVLEVAAASDVAIHLLSSEERLPAVKRNEGLHRATGDLVLFMNDDVWVGRDFVAEHVSTHLAHDEPIAVLGHIDQSAQMPQNPFIEWYLPFSYYELADRADKTVTYRYHWTMNLSLPREVLLERNLVFHEDWSEIGNEDVELGYRWTRAGYEIIYNPRAWGEHYHPHDLATACRLQESIGRGLRDVEVLIPEPDLLERFGVFSLRNSPRAIARGVARKTLFNRFTVPYLLRRWESPTQRSRVAEWSYWKIMLFHLDRGYRSVEPRSPAPVPVPTRPLADESAAHAAPIDLRTDHDDSSVTV